VTPGLAAYLSGPEAAGLLLLDGSGGVTLADGRAEDLLGRSAAQIGADWPELRRRLEAEAGDGGLWRRPSARVAAEVPVDGGSRRLVFDIARVAGSGGSGYLVRLRLEAEAEAIAQDLRLASQMHTLSRLYRSIAHDLRGPLNTMVVNLELLTDSVAPGATGDQLEDRRRRYVRVMKDETMRMVRYVKAFLAGVAPPVYGERDVDLAAELTEAAEFAGAQARRQGVDLDVELPADELQVRGSADDLRQVVLALLTNALEAQPDGGWVGLGGERENGAVRVWVEDEGPGIPPGVEGHLFEPGFSTRPDARGMGLAVARAIARRHGGDLRLDEAPGDGSRFVLELPAARSEEG